MKGYKAIIASMGLETKAKMEQNINSINGILLTEAKDIQERWVELILTSEDREMLTWTESYSL